MAAIDHQDEARAMIQARRERDKAWAAYQGANAAYKRAERKLLGHYPRSNPPDPFFCDGLFVQVNHGYERADCDECFSYTEAQEIPA